jgi:N-acetylmuramoyl-L-alanine amidase
MKAGWLWAGIVAFGLSGIAPAGAAPVSVQEVRLWAAPEGTRVVLDLSADAKYTLLTLASPDRVVVDLRDARLDRSKVPLPAGAGLVKQVRVAPRDGGDLRVVLDLERRVRAQALVVPPNERYGHRLVIDLGAPDAAAPAPAPRVTKGPLPGARDLVIAIDAGHGGEDPGAIGRKGTREKDVTLSIARVLASRIDAEPGMRAVLTRDGDYFVPLRERIRRARAANADLFVSVHADAVADRSVAGSSVYILSARGATSEAARRLAARENAADLIGGVTLSDKDPVLASVLLDLSQSASMSASQVAAEKVLEQLNDVGSVRKARVQQAGFVVLKSPDIPSMLIETAYITNPGDETRLRDPKHQSRLADAILSGVRGYFRENPPPGTRMAALAGERTADASLDGAAASGPATGSRALSP